MIMSDEIIDNNKAAKLLFNTFYKEEVNCPSCGKIIDDNKIFKNKYYMCSCGKKFSWRTGTVFEGTKISAAKLVLLIDGILEKYPDKKIIDNLKITSDTLRLWKYKINHKGDLV